jgi:hypothetical protein
LLDSRGVALGQFGAVCNIANPATDSLQEAQISLSEKVGSCGLRCERPTSNTVDYERDAYLRAHVEPQRHAD